MADKTINALTYEATTISDDDLFVLQQDGVAKKLRGEVLTDYVTREVLNVHVSTVSYTATPQSSYNSTTRELDLQLQRGPGISSIDYLSSSGKVDTYTITTEDNHTSTFTVTNGDGLVNSVAGIAPATGTFNIDKYALMDLMWPVGSVYQALLGTASSIANPGYYFGGVWLPLKDVFLLAKGDTYTTNAGTGGTAENTVNFGNGSAMFGFGNGQAIAMKSKVAPFVCDNLIHQPVEAFSGTVDYATALAGTQTLDNLPPYKIVNMWYRVPGTAYTSIIPQSSTPQDNVWSSGKYLNTSGATASYSNSNNYQTITVSDISEGDKFIVFCRGGANPRRWAWLRSDKSTVISAADSQPASNATLYEEIITAPENAAYLAVNAYKTNNTPWALGKIS